MIRKLIPPSIEGITPAIGSPNQLYQLAGGHNAPPTRQR